jgi:hypothetical protein
MRRNRSIKDANRFLSRAAACSVAAALAPCALAVTPELILDLRLPGGGKSASINAVGDTVDLQLYALVHDANPGTDGFNVTQGAWQSTAGGLRGNLAASLASGFDQFGSQNPVPADMDSDGDLDVGASASASAGHWIASAGTSGSFASQGSEIISGENYRRWLIGTGVFTVTSLGGYHTQINYVPRTGAAPVNPHKYYSDSATMTSILGTDPRLQIGAPIHVTGPVTWLGGVGNWSTAGKWNSGVVPGMAGESVWIDDSGVVSAVMMDVNATVDRLTITAADSLTIASGRTLVVNSTLTNAGSVILAAGGSAVFSGTCAGNGAIGNDGAVTFAAAALVASIGQLDGVGAVTVQAGRTLSTAHLRQGNAQINGIVNIRPNGGAAGVSRLATLAVGPSGKLDLANNSLVLNNGTGPGTWNGSNYTGVSGMIRSGRNGGGWDGNAGIVTSQTSATTSNFTSLGIATAAQAKTIASTATAVWAGQTVTGTETLVMYTYGGDANLDGKINVDDYGRIDSNIGLGTAGWYNGDFNYDGKVNVDDYGVIDSNIGIQGAPFFTAGGGAALAFGGVTAVPEPVGLASVVLLAGTSLMLSRRRHRHQRRLSRALSD